MNWYKKIILSSKNIQFPDDIEEQIDEISNKTVEYYFSQQNEKIFGGTFNFINPYNNQLNSIPTIIHPFTIEFKNTIAIFNPQKRILSIFPYHHNIKDINPSNFFNYIKSYIYHEITHAIDPKFLIEDWWRNRQDVDYLLREEEFDAYSKQIEQTIKNNINDINIENLKMWLKTDNTDLMPGCLKDHLDIIQYWKINKPIYMKKLKQRLYNFFIG
jgi:hypothetical protein